MTDDTSKKFACELLRKKDADYERILGSERTSKDGRDVWVVFFKAKLPQGVIMMVPETIIVVVDDATGEAEIFPSL